VQAYGLAVVNHFEMMGVPTLNGAAGIAASRNKMRALQLLAAGGVPVPPTVMAANASELKALVELVGGLPVLIKLLTPSERPLVMLCESLQSMEAALERSEEHTSELQSRGHLVCRLLLEKKNQAE